MRIFLILSLICLVTGVSFAQFEGVIEMKLTRTDGSDQRSVTTSMMMKGQRILTTAGGIGRDSKEVKVIYAGDKNLLWMIDDAKKSYMEIPLDSMPSPEIPAKEGQLAAPRKTGKTETILGYTCDEWVVADSAAETHLWATPKLGNVYEGFSKALGNLTSRGRGSSGLSSWQKEFIAMKAFPLKTERYRNGTLFERQEMTRVEEKNLSQSLFDAPPGYTKQTLPPGMGKMIDQMRQQMQDKQKGGASEGKPDVDKLMKEMQEKMKNLQNGSGDSTKQQQN